MARPTWADALPWPLIQVAAQKYGINKNLVAAVVHIESSGESYSNRFEKLWDDYVTPEVFAKKLGISLDTERVNQACSWGLMHIMGAVARELGFAGPLPQLCRPDVGLDWGCKKLKKFLVKYPDLKLAIASYNGGSPQDRNQDGVIDNQKYIDLVFNAFTALGG